MKLTRREVILIVVAVALAAVCVRLGIWQISRLHQRQARNAALRAAWSRPPLDLPASVAPESIAGRRIRAHGTYDYANENFWRPRSLDDMPGVDLVTPLRLSDGTAVLIDRGFVESADAYHVNEAAYREGDTATVDGLAFPAPRGRGDVDPRALAGSVPYRLLPVVVQAESQPGAGPEFNAPRRLPPPELSNGPHLSYTIQWFCFAVIILVGTGALLRKERAEPPVDRT